MQAIVAMNNEQVIHSVLPQFFPKHWLDSPGKVYCDFPSRICIGYVIRGEAQYSYIVEPELSQLHMSVEELRAAAIANLARLPSASISIAKVPGGAEGWISATNDNFAAVRVLLPDIQQHFSDVLGRDFLLSLPNRDECVCWSLKQPLERQQKHYQEAIEHFLHDDYNLTPDILCFSGGCFRLYREWHTDAEAAGH